MTNWDNASGRLQTTLARAKPEDSLTGDEIRTQRMATLVARRDMAAAETLLQAKMRKFQRARVTWKETKAILNEHSPKDYGYVESLWQETLSGVR